MAYKYRFDSALHHATKHLPHDDSSYYIDITDDFPHITWTDTHQFVILQIQSDKSLYIFTNDNTVTKIPFHVHSRKDFDFRECLFEEHGVTTFAKPDKFARCLTIDETDPQFGAHTKFPKQHRSIIGEFYDKQFLALDSQPTTVHRRSLTDDSESNPARQFTFRNFDEPNKDFYDCWYHPSNDWKPAPVQIFMCLKTTKDILVHNHDTSFPSIGVMVRPPLPHQCGVNSCLIDSSISRFLFKCPSSFVISSNPDDPIVQCLPKFTYRSIPISHLIDDEELDSLLTDVIISFARAWNLPHYRCRFEFDNHFSQFWLSKPLSERMIDVLAKPNHNVPSLLITNQYRAAANIPSIKTLVPDLHVLDLGLYLVSTVLTTSPSDIGHFDISTIPNLVFSFVDDMDARDRGFTWYHKHFDYILYMNIKEPNLYAFGNLKTNVFIDMKIVDGQLLRAWRRYEHVVRPHIVTATQDLRPLIRQEHPDDAKRFTIPGTDVIVHPGQVYPFKVPFHQIEWTPILIACSKTCRPPKTLYQFHYNQNTLKANAIKGVRRSITIRNDFFNNLIRHDTFAVCTSTFAHRWKISKYGPVSFLVCGSLFNEYNVLDFHDIIDDPSLTGSVLTVTFQTFSPTFGLCGFTPSMIHQFTDSHPIIDDSDDIKLTTLPQWPCSPNCRTPPTISKIKIHDDPEFRTWLSELALNVYKLKYQHSETTGFKCSINPHAQWRVITKGRYQTFFCDNFALFGLNFQLPVHHPKRWILSYCFTEEELSSLPWIKAGNFWTATLSNAVVTRQRKQFPLYSVTWTPTGESCVFHLGRLGMAQPILDYRHTHPLVYNSPFEADSKAMGTLLRGLKMDSITSNTLEAMTLRVLQHNRALEHDLFKLTLESKGSSSPHPFDPDWLELSNKFATALALDATVTPELTQSENGVDNSLDTVNTVRNPLIDSTYQIFNLSLDDSSTQTSSQSTSSDSTL